MSFWYKISAIFLCVALFQLVVPDWYNFVLRADELSFGALSQEADTSSETHLKDKILFYGDIMLARDVERIINTHSLSHPFLGTTIPEDSFAVGNLETTVPKEHLPTPNNTFRFSTPVRFLPALAAAGFTHLSLANNHSFDHGLAGYNHTVSSLWEAELTPFGHPSVLDTASITYLDTKHGRVAIIGVHTLYGAPSSEVIQEVLTKATESSKLQIVYIHWGEEYELKQNNSQRALASVFAAAGADIIVGHHPHVTQGVELVDGALVFYSLGNYIFDQYFSPDVQEGLVLELSLGDEPYVSLMPVTSAEHRAQPHPHTPENRQIFLEKLAERSSPELAEAIATGRISLIDLLATSE